MRSRRLVGAASTLLLLILLRAAGAEMPPPGTVITAENLERYREALFPTAEYFLRHGMTITVIPYRRWQWTALYKEATEKFASQVRLRSTDATCRAARWLRFGIAGYGNLYYPFWGDHGNLQDLRRARCAPREYGPRQASLEVRGVARGIGTATQGQSRQGRRQSV